MLLPEWPQKQGTHPARKDSPAEQLVQGVAASLS